MLWKQLIVLLFVWHTGCAKPKCEKLLHHLATCQGQFTYCIGVRSVPSTMCIGCQIEYKNMTTSYEDITAIQNCTDHINLVSAMQSVLKGFWSNYYCDNCFVNNNSDIFWSKNASLSSCLNEKPTQPCEECLLQYEDLNSFYIELSQSNNGKVCQDLHDSMNGTRNKWSKELNCCRRQFNMTLFLVATTLVGLLPILFYGTTYAITRRRERNHGTINDEDPSLAVVPPSQLSSTRSVAPNVQSVANGHQPNTEEPSVEAKKIFATDDEDSDGDSDPNIADNLKQTSNA